MVVQLGIPQSSLKRQGGTLWAKLGSKAHAQSFNFTTAERTKKGIWIHSLCPVGHEPKTHMGHLYHFIYIVNTCK
jgi:hypothetical protein